MQHFNISMHTAIVLIEMYYVEAGSVVFLFLMLCAPLS